MLRKIKEAADRAVGVATSHPKTFAGVFLGVMLGLQLSTYRLTNATVDEPFHVARGLAFWWEGDARLSYAHPPLANAVAALPHIFDEHWFDFSESETWQEADCASAAVRLFAGENYDRALTTLYRSRLTMIILTFLFGVYFYFRVSRLFGEKTALLCTYLYSISSPIIAMGSLVTTDFPILAATTILVLEWFIYLRKPSLLRLCWVGLLIGVVAATKHSGIFVILFFFLAVLVAFFKGWSVFSGRTSRWKFLLQHFITGAVGALLVVNAAYLFQDTGMSVRELMERKGWENYLIEETYPEGDLLAHESPLRHLPGWMPVPLPYTYLYGVYSLKMHQELGHTSYLLGMRSSQGFPVYYLVLLAIKSPIIVTVLLMLGVVFWVRGRETLQEVKSVEIRIVLLLVAAMLAISCFSHANIGIRHISPIMGLLIILSSRLFLRMYSSSKVCFQLILILLLAEGMIAKVFAWPEYLADFNLLAGGQKYGCYASITGEDWGQDARATAKVVRDLGIDSIIYDEYTIGSSEEFRKCGIAVYSDYKMCKAPIPPTAHVVVHRSIRFRNADEECLKRFEEAILLGVVNNHVEIYWFDLPPVMVPSGRDGVASVPGT